MPVAPPRYTPGLAYSALTVGVDLIALHLFGRCGGAGAWRRPLLAWGKSPLLFYVLHWWTLQAAAFLWWEVSGSVGLPLPWVLLPWALVLGLMFVVCERYARFKATTAITSVWRFF